MFVDVFGPSKAKTVSTRLVNVRSSPRSSLLFLIVYEQTYGSPTFVGVSQPFENPIPCSLCAEALNAPSENSTPIKHKPAKPVKPIRRTIRPPRFDSPTKPCAQRQAAGFLPQHRKLRHDASARKRDRRPKNKAGRYRPSSQRESGRPSPPALWSFSRTWE